MLTGLPANADLPASFKGEGLIDFVNNLGELKIDFPGDPGGVNAEEWIFANGDSYNPLPPSVQQQLKSKAKWVRTSKDEGGSAANVFSQGPFGLANPTDPTAMLNALRNISTSVNVIGHPRVRGVETTEYSAVTDPSKLASQMDLSAALPGAFGPTSIRVFVDADRLVRRIEMDSKIAEVTTTFAVDFYDYGASVRVRIPPSSEVIDSNDLSNQLNPMPMCASGSPASSSKSTSSCDPNAGY